MPETSRDRLLVIFFVWDLPPKSWKLVPRVPNSPKTYKSI